MDSIWLWPLALVALLLAWPALRPLAARLFPDPARPQALAPQPDHIYLLRVIDHHWRHPEPRAAAQRDLAAAGFVEAGTYVVREMPDLTLELHAHPAERAYAILYDHTRSGFWAELVTRYTDGTLATYTTLEPLELDLPEGSVHVAAPKTPLAELWKRMLAERPKKSSRECSRSGAARDFERGYAESVAHHKRKTTPVETDGAEHRRTA